MFDECDQVHISVVFTWDLGRAEWLYRQWKYIAPTEIGGPATGMMGGDFQSGLYIKPGYTITSRGCPNKCWFCSVWRREGNIRELPIVPGNNILDDNLLACSDNHINRVFDMLEQQPGAKELTGGLEAARFEAWHLERIMSVHGMKQVFFAYDSPDDLAPLKRVSEMIRDIQGRSRLFRCYVLCGYERDEINVAQSRMEEMLRLGFIPMAMLYKNENGQNDLSWKRFQRQWARPANIMGMVKRRIYEDI